MTKKSLNGSTNLLAKAMRQVFSEAIEGAVEPLCEGLDEVRTDIKKGLKETNEKIDAGLKTTNKNVC